MTYILGTCNVVMSTNDQFTSNNPTAQSRDALYLCQIVLDEVVVTVSAAHVSRHTEFVPQLTGHCGVSHYHSLRAHIKAISYQSPVSQHADPTAITGTDVDL